MVKEMIANQRLLLKSGKLSDAGSNPGKLKSATGKMVSMPPCYQTEYCRTVCLTCNPVI